MPNTFKQAFTGLRLVSALFFGCNLSLLSASYLQADDTLPPLFTVEQQADFEAQEPLPVEPIPNEQNTLEVPDIPEIPSTSITEFIYTEQAPDFSLLEPISPIPTDNSELLQQLWQKTYPTQPERSRTPQITNTKPIEETAPQKLIVTPPIISIIIDDLGYNRRGMQSSLKLPVEVALAILPHTPYSTATAVASQKQSRVIILHSPMENTRKLALGPGGLYSAMAEEEFKQTLQNSIDSVPGVTGLNNHMGSLLTQNEESMQWVMDVIQPMGLFFVDSVTSGNSVAYSQAKNMGLTSVKRDVFLDNIRTEAAIDKQFQRLLRIARRDGHALAIGHPYPSTMEYLYKQLPFLEEEGVQLVSINEYIQTINE